MIKFVFKDHYDKGEDKNMVVLLNHDDNCTDVVRDFYRFLLAVSYSPSTVLIAMQDVVDEHSEGNK